MMKFAVCLLVAVVGLTSALNVEYSNKIDYVENVQGPFDGMINSTINKIIANLTDPLIINDLNINVENNTLLVGDLNVSKATVGGVHGIVASKIDLELLSFALNMTIDVPELAVNLKYSTDLVLAELVPLYGLGLIGVNLNGVSIMIYGKANLSRGLKINNMTLTFTIKEAVFNINGLLNNPEFSALVSTALNDNFVDFVDDNKVVISNIISPIAEEIINQILSSPNSAEAVEYLVEALTDYRKTL